MLCGAGVRQDNRSAERTGSMQKRGYRFLTDDEDEYGLEDILQVPSLSSYPALHAS